MISPSLTELLACAVQDATQKAAGAGAGVDASMAGLRITPDSKLPTVPLEELVANQDYSAVRCWQAPVRVACAAALIHLLAGGPFTPLAAPQSPRHLAVRVATGTARR